MNITFNVTPPKSVYNAISKNVSGDNRKKSGKSKFFFLLTAVTVVAVFVIKAAEKIRETEIKLCMNYDTEKSGFKAKDKGDYKTINNDDEFQEQVHQEPQKHYLDDEDAEEKTERTFKFTVNKSAKKYHLKECGAVKKLAEEKRDVVEIKADTLESAQRQLEQQGYALCGLCKR